MRPAPLKDNARQHVEALRAAAEKPPAEARAAAVGPLEALKTAAAVASGIGSLVAAVAKVFGL